uniref:DUF5901 domain-containing protein n=1 Tax=viral metagenome TaxID=1070528 RepID=A0A6C0M5Z6_9ZZZZ
MSQYVLKQEYPLIPREQTYSVSRKLLTVHSEDRDINKWPNANHFEIQLPQTYTNVETIALVEYSFPTYYYTFSNENQNTKLTFVATIAMAGYGETNPVILTISPGFYSPTQLATEMQNQLNLTVRALSPSLSTYDNFRVFYDEVRQRLLFGNKEDPFTFVYDAPYSPPITSDANSYTSQRCSAPCIYENNGTNGTNGTQPSANIRWNKYTNWGLGYNLGFNKCLPSECGNPNDVTKSNRAIAGAVSQSQSVHYVNPTPPTIGYEWLTVAAGNTGYVIVPPNPPSLNGQPDMYLEIDKCNSMDEMQPYSAHTSNARNNDYNGIVNAAFAKIPIRTKPTKIVSMLEYVYGNEPNDTCEGMMTYFPPLDKLNKFKFKFRYHDGTLVDFGGQNFSFTIALYAYRDEIARANQLRIPFRSP